MTRLTMEKLQELRARILEEVSDDTVVVRIAITSEGITVETETRNAEALRRDGISMQNVRGEWIRLKGGAS